jgi:hypothetical protein
MTVEDHYICNNKQILEELDFLLSRRKCSGSNTIRSCTLQMMKKSFYSNSRSLHSSRWQTSAYRTSRSFLHLHTLLTVTSWIRTGLYNLGAFIHRLIGPALDTLKSSRCADLTGVAVDGFFHLRLIVLIFSGQFASSHFFEISNHAFFTAKKRIINMNATSNS